jgi:hypothetical protein
VNTEIFGPSDPRITLALAPERGIADSLFNEFNELVFGDDDSNLATCTTSSKLDTLFPVWNETFEFEVGESVEDKVLIVDVHDTSGTMFSNVNGEKMVTSRDQLLRVLSCLNLTSVYKPDMFMIEAVAANANIEEWYPVTIAHIHANKDEPDTAELAAFDIIYEDHLLPPTHGKSTTQSSLLDGLEKINTNAEGQVVHLQRDYKVPFHFLRGFEGGFLPDEIAIGQKVDCRYRGDGHTEEDRFTLSLPPPPPLLLSLFFAFLLMVSSHPPSPSNCLLLADC